MHGSSLCWTLPFSSASFMQQLVILDNGAHVEFSCEMYPVTTQSSIFLRITPDLSDPPSFLTLSQTLTNAGWQSSLCTTLPPSCFTTDNHACNHNHTMPPYLTCTTQSPCFLWPSIRNSYWLFQGQIECLHLSNTRVAQEVLQHFLYCSLNQNQQEMPAQFFL